MRYEMSRKTGAHKITPLFYMAVAQQEQQRQQVWARHAQDGFEGVQRAVAELVDAFDRDVHERGNLLIAKVFKITEIDHFLLPGRELVQRVEQLLRLPPEQVAVIDFRRGAEAECKMFACGKGDGGIAVCFNAHIDKCIFQGGHKVVPDITGCSRSGPVLPELYKKVLQAILDQLLIVQLTHTIFIQAGMVVPVDCLISLPVTA